MDWKEFVTPLNIAIALGTLVIIIITIIIFVLIERFNFKKKLIGLLEDHDQIDNEYSTTLSRSRVLAKSSQIEKISRKYGLEILNLCRINQYWLEELKLHNRKALFNRVLTYYPEKGLFTCFLMALEKKEYASRLLHWVNESEEFLIMRRIALSGVGEQFNGKRAYELFTDNLPQIREMTGDPEWASRYFAIKILLYDKNDQSLRAIWECFRDPHSLVRKTIATEFNNNNREKLYNELYRLFLEDPVLEVRAAAKERINRDFTDIYNISIDSLPNMNALHALEHLSEFSKADEDTAMKFLNHDNLELRFAAAVFLEQRGALNKLIEKADFGDREDLERTEKLLNKSCEVHITSFLEKVVKYNNPGSYYIAVSLLTEIGESSLIDPICQKIFSLPQTNLENKMLFDKALLCIEKRGPEKAIILLKDYLIKHKSDGEYSGKILNSIPKRASSIFLPLLMDFICDSQFEARSELRAAIIRFPSDLYIQKMLKIVKSARGEYSHAVRIDALKILIEMRQSFCLQTILENFPILPISDAREQAKLLVGYDREEFNKLGTLIFQTDDAAVRASFISCLPAVDGKIFMKQIRDALSDADPEMRIAAIWALVDFKEKKTISQAIAMLRDPVERVRTEVARAIAEIGSDAALDELKVLLDDENEVKSVKIPAIIGLSGSTSLISIDIICNLLSNHDAYDRTAIKALSKKITKKEIGHMLEVFRDGTPVLRNKLTLVFTKMKESGEMSLVSLLKEDITALKPFICQVLENTGYIESQIRLLKHRDRLIRIKAATELSFIGTESAFRGIVLAARDSDKEVRISVTKALEKLNNPEGTKILKSLTEDPDKKVRKYTAWALERIASKNLDE